MSTNIRQEPFLSDDAVERVIPSLPQEDLFWAEYGGRAVRDFYEQLIASGKIRVVKEVRYSRTAINIIGPSSYGCYGCKKSFRISGERIDGTDKYHEWTFCPGCGNPIKR